MSLADRLNYQTRITRTVRVERTARVLQLNGLFDLPLAEESVQTWDVNLALPEQWNVGLIVGPSGAGKSTLARELWPNHLAREWPWPREKSILDGFSQEVPIKELTGLLCSVGFSSPPSWLRPFHVLSNGEQFRVNMARTLAELPDLAVVDEFTSVVDRDVARIVSAAVQKAIRRRQQKFVAVTCHYDVAEWLEPDWIYQPHTGELIAGRSLRRPPIELDVRRVHRSAWELFRPHHYLSGDLHKIAYCFVAFTWGRPAAFCAVIHFPHHIRPGWKEHRTVCLPDFQGVGIGNALSEYVASIFRATGKPYRDTTGHPGHVHHRRRSPLWKTTRAMGILRATRTRNKAVGLRNANAFNRLTCSFEYIGPARPEDARRFGIL
jgi:energy-coupling factor transporter ATP-binding protein EcfA2